MSTPAHDRPAPDWFAPLQRLIDDPPDDALSRFVPPPGHQRRSAVLMLFGADQPHGLDVLLTERASTLRSHPGQVSFPGGKIDPTDDDAQGAALREAVEETGLDPAGVQIAGCLPDLYLTPSDFAVTPVLAWWREPSPVGVVDPGEVARVVRAPIAHLSEPENRFLVTHPSGFRGPGFSVEGLFVWGFTAGLLDRVMTLAGWARPWDSSRVVPVPALPRPADVDRVEAGGER